MSDQPTTAHTIPINDRLSQTETALAKAIVECEILREQNESLRARLDTANLTLRDVRGEMATRPLSFSHLRRANLIRCKESFHYSPDEWSPERWMLAMGGELGETLEAVLKMVMSGGLAMNSLKKVIRGDGDVADVGREVADVYIYGDFVLNSLGLDTAETIQNKFNETSRKVGSEVFL